MTKKNISLLFLLLVLCSCNDKQLKKTEFFYIEKNSPNTFKSKIIKKEKSANKETHILFQNLDSLFEITSNTIQKEILLEIKDSILHYKYYQYFSFRLQSI